MQRPTSIIAFEWAMWASFFVALVSGLLDWDAILELYRTEPAIAAMGFGSGFIIAMWVFSFGLTLLFWFTIARKGSKVAKWIYAVLMGLGVLMTLLTLTDPATLGGVSMIGSLVSSALTTVSIFYLFRPDTAEWFAGRRPVDPDTFR